MNRLVFGVEALVVEQFIERAHLGVLETLQNLRCIKGFRGSDQLVVTQRHVFELGRRRDRALQLVVLGAQVHLPHGLLRDLVASAGRTLDLGARREGLTSTTPRSGVVDALLDSVVLTVASASGAVVAPAYVPAP